MTSPAQRGEAGMIFRGMIQARTLQHDADAPRQRLDCGLACLSPLVAPAPGRLVPPPASQRHQDQLPIRTPAELAAVAGALQHPRPRPLPFRTFIEVPDLFAN